MKYITFISLLCLFFGCSKQNPALWTQRGYLIEIESDGIPRVYMQYRRGDELTNIIQQPPYPFEIQISEGSNGWRTISQPTNADIRIVGPARCFGGVGFVGFNHFSNMLRILATNGPTQIGGGDGDSLMSGALAPILFLTNYLPVFDRFVPNYIPQ